MIDLHNRENSLWNVLLHWKMMLKRSQNYNFCSLYSSKSTFLLMKSEKIEIKDGVQDNKNKNSPSQHGTACCALMHSAIYITFSQSGSQLSSNEDVWLVVREPDTYGCGSFRQVGARFVTVSMVTFVNIPSIIIDYKCTFTVVLQIRMKSISPPSTGNYNNVN